jgi:hypothetical protein
MQEELRKLWTWKTKMDFLTYILTSLVSFTGLIVGIILSRISPEEMPTGRKFFPLVQKIALVAIAAIFISSLVSNLFLRLLLYAAAIFLLNIKLSPQIVYPLLAVPFALTLENQAFMPIAVMVFVYGLPTGSLYSGKNSGLFLYSAPKLSFIALAAILYFI